MSATIPSNKQLDDLLKSTGFDCPENLKGKSFAEATSDATSGGGSVTLVSVQSDVLFTAGKPVKYYWDYDKSLDDKHVVWFKKEQTCINTRDFVEGRTYKYMVQNPEGVTFDITLKKEVSGSKYKIAVEFKDRGNAGRGLYCFLVVGMSN